MLMVVEQGNSNLPPGTEDSVDKQRRWILILQYNTYHFLFGDFIDEILRNIETHLVPDNYNNERCLLWKNVSLYKTSYVTTMIRDRQTMNNFYTVNKSPYRPKVAPIEDVFCEFAAELTCWYTGGI